MLHHPGNNIMGKVSQPKLNKYTKENTQRTKSKNCMQLCHFIPRTPLQDKRCGKFMQHMQQHRSELVLI